MLIDKGVIRLNRIKSSIITKIGFAIFFFVFIIFIAYYQFLNFQIKTYLEDQRTQQLQKESDSLCSEINMFLQKYIILIDLAKNNNDYIKLAKEVDKIPGVKITRNVDANAVFAIIPPYSIEALRSKYRFYTWDEQTTELRWMCSFDTTEDEIRDFAKTLAELV